ncbi:iron chelate uptake ABC transporter family permease subunit [Nocardiopsis sp. CT-R113]|uniref:Iron chelate uptake ABC transporter family permease subunit n=1 Tax=Nocardiopsis codii TaxID=3065942 RepID=A0ABU7KCZ2_9ACTN|nr:iron chelate uptake ABC transporter family permease subunit [Nocardiopsis sp. CT-R113]MEE2039892.1 iron chelate uptake ABC transporter family permease subunit [Nocardiopsis sp. CT-R113]
MTSTLTPLPARERPARRGRAVRLGPVSMPLRPRLIAAGALTTAVLAVLVALNLSVGDVFVPPDRVWANVIGTTYDDYFTIWRVRMPRVVVGMLAGAALTAAGAITQTIMRNPLASPDLLGVTHGASAGVVAIMAFGGSYGIISGPLAQVGVPAVALAGGLAAGALCYGLAWRGGIDGFRLLLVGVGVSTVLMNVTLWMLTLGEVTDSGRAMVWIAGSLSMRTWPDALPVALALAVLLPLALASARTLDVLSYGDDVVRGLGVRLELARTAMLVLAVLLAAFGTAAAGPILFVSLACPQIALRLARTPRPPVLLSALVGAALTCAADLVARTLFDGVQLPVGIVTGCLGALYLIYLLVRGNRKVQA